MAYVNPPVFQFLILNFELWNLNNFKYITQLTPTGSHNSDNLRPIHPDMNCLIFPDDAPIVIGWLSQENLYSTTDHIYL